MYSRPYTDQTSDLCEIWVLIIYEKQVTSNRNEALREKTEKETKKNSFIEPKDLYFYMFSQPFKCETFFRDLQTTTLIKHKNSSKGDFLLICCYTLYHRFSNSFIQKHFIPYVFIKVNLPFPNTGNIKGLIKA